MLHFHCSQCIITEIRLYNERFPWTNRNSRNSQTMEYNVNMKQQKLQLNFDISLCFTFVSLIIAVLQDAIFLYFIFV